MRPVAPTRFDPLSAQAMSQTTAMAAPPGRVCVPGQRLAEVETLTNLIENVLLVRLQLGDVTRHLLLTSGAKEVIVLGDHDASGYAHQDSERAKGALISPARSR